MTVTNTIIKNPSKTQTTVKKTLVYNNNHNIISNTTGFIKPLFTNNTTHYKPHSLSTGGVGTVRNHRHKGLYT